MTDFEATTPNALAVTSENMVIRELRGVVDRQAARTERLEAFIVDDLARCPCCEESVRCAKDCTFSDDCPIEWAHMMKAREALKGVGADDVADNVPA